jgi:dTDP-4-dehydrorhamnose 3,5-epimerase-like enzyme
MKLSSKLISTERGDLNEYSFKDINIKRMFIVSDVPPGSTRGYHAHKKTKQYLCCISGKIEVLLDNGHDRKKYTLEKSNYLFQDSLIWAEIKFLDKESKLLVVCSTEHDESDYIREYEQFKKMKR